MEREAAILARMSPDDAEDLRAHLREMRSDRWAREVITQSVEVMTAVGARQEASEKSLDALRVEIMAFRPRVEALLEAEAAAKSADAKRTEAGADRARTIGEGVRDVMTSTPAMVLYGGLAVWVLGRLGVAIESVPAMVLP